MPKLGTICITNQAPNKAVIDIEGIIGIPEWWQFEDPADRVATFDKFKKKCNEIRDLKATDITVNIRSIGGDVSHALLIHDSLCELEGNVTTVCYGYTASAATLIAQAGKTRQISNNALYLIHQCSTVVRGNIADLKDSIDTMEKTNQRIVNIYATRTGKPAEHFREIIDRKNGNGEWLSPEDTVKSGLADEIITVSGAVNIDLDLFAEMGYPEIPENLFRNPEENTDINQKNNFMTKIKNTLSALWAFCNFPADQQEQEITDQHLLNVNNELAARQETINNLTTERDQLKNTVTAKDQEITNLKNKIVELNGKAGATTTETTNATDNGGTDDAFSDISAAKDLYNSIKDY